MPWIKGKTRKKLEAVTQELETVRTRSDLLDSACGVGLWQAIMHDGDAMHPNSRWSWSAEFRRLVGYESETDFPDVVQSWSDRLHPDDVAPTFAKFTGHLADKTGRTRYDAIYRLRLRDNSYQWFRATGGCKHLPDGRTIVACGSLTNINEQKEAALTMSRDAEESKTVIDVLASGLSALAGGDLQFRLSAALPDHAASLRQDFNTAMGKLQETLQAVASNADAIRLGSGEISSASDDLARRTEQQAASLEETAAALDEITATVKKTSESSLHARDVVASAKQDAEHSGEVVSQAVQAMSVIEKSAQQVSQIIGVIDEIAFQTNLLALNAGVEAARAGEAGRGFAVVASEVRGLAQRSAEAAKEIKALISASSRQVAEGVSLVNETGRALERIVTQVSEINGVVSEIASSTQEQATALQQVNAAVNQMDQVTQQNAAMVEQSTAASQSLAGETESLSRLMGAFRLGQERTSRPERTARQPAVTHRPAPARSAPAMKTTGRGGAARRPEPASDAGDWEEF